ncbi:hypothetical protein HOY80DRAFT_1108628 [Tuber brumale]|nr:hypothetical protein HOY80DRAFT_1108628 [Tuber brumale]
MSSKKRQDIYDKDNNSWAPKDRPTPPSMQHDGPASRLRSRQSLSCEEPATSLKEVQSTPPPEPVRKQNFEVVIWKRAPMQIPVEIKRERKNAFSETIIDRWPVAEAREGIEEEIALRTRGLHTKDDASSSEKEVVSKMKWANRLLREGYWAFVQKVPASLPASSSRRSQSHRKEKSADSNPRGSACNFPTCGKLFQDGQYRISFEPPFHLGTSSVSKAIIDLTQGDDKGVEGGNSISDDVEKYTFCLPCFDRLLMPYTQGRGNSRPTDPFSQILATNEKLHPPQPGYLRPSPSCRIYDRIQPETRPKSNRSFNLSPKERDTIKTWKTYNYNKGLSMMSRRNGFMFARGLDFYQENCKVSGLDGIGIAEFMSVHFPKNPASYHSMQEVAINRATGESGHNNYPN